jgi:hypothetical protein
VRSADGFSFAQSLPVPVAQPGMNKTLLFEAAHSAIGGALHSGSALGRGTKRSAASVAVKPTSPAKCNIRC